MGQSCQSQPKVPFDYCETKAKYIAGPVSLKFVIVNCRKVTFFRQDIPPESQAQAEEKLKNIETSFEGLSAAIENKDVPGIITNKRAILSQIGDVEQLMVKGFPYE